MSTHHFLRAILSSQNTHRYRWQSTIRHLHSTSRLQANQLPKRNLRSLTALSFATALSITTYAAGAIYPPDQLTLLFPRPAPAPPSDPTSPSSLAYIESLETTLQSLPVLVSLRSRPDSDDWYETRPYTNIPEERRVNNLTAGTLRGPGKLALPPIVRARKDETEAVAIVHVGRALCGHDGIVHGGLLATILDETLARIAIPNLPDKVGVTAQLSINYRAPTKADQFIVIKTKLIETKGRKAIVSGHVEDIKGILLVDATATFVQPRYAKLLNAVAIKQALGFSQPPVNLAHGEKLQQKEGVSN